MRENNEDNKRKKKTKVKKKTRKKIIMGDENMEKIPGKKSKKKGNKPQLRR